MLETGQLIIQVLASRKGNIMDETILKKSLEIPPKDRVALAEAILASIDHEDDETRLEWISEVKNRIKAVEDGQSELVDFERILNEDKD